MVIWMQTVSPRKAIFASATSVPSQPCCSPRTGGRSPSRREWIDLLSKMALWLVGDGCGLAKRFELGAFLGTEFPGGRFLGVDVSAHATRKCQFPRDGPQGQPFQPSLLDRFPPGLEGGRRPTLLRVQVLLARSFSTPEVLPVAPAVRTRSKAVRHRWWDLATWRSPTLPTMQREILGHGDQWVTPAHSTPIRGGGSWRGHRMPAGTLTARVGSVGSFQELAPAVRRSWDVLHRAAVARPASDTARVLSRATLRVCLKHRTSDRQSCRRHQAVGMVPDARAAR